MIFPWSKKDTLPLPEAPHVKIYPEPCKCLERQAEYIQTVDTLNEEIERLRKEKQVAVEGIQEAKNKLTDDIREAKESLAKADLAHKMKVEDIKHMQKLLDEKNALELEKKIFSAEKAADKEIKAIRLEYTKKLENDLKSQMTKLDSTYTAILDALPNVNVKMKVE